MKISGVILAAGHSRRMQPKNKLLLPIKNATVIETTAAALAASQVDEVIIVIGHEHERVTPLLSAFESSKFRVLYNFKFEAGRAESIKCAVNSFDAETEAALFMPADKPGVTTELIDKAIGKFKTTKPLLLYVSTPSGRGHPVIFARSLFDELMLLSGDTVGAGLIDRYADSTSILSDDKDQIDIDTPEDYQRFLKHWEQQIRIV